jgi:hypothetical protein
MPLTVSRKKRLVLVLWALQRRSLCEEFDAVVERAGNDSLAGAVAARIVIDDDPDHDSEANKNCLLLCRH